MPATNRIKLHRVGPGQYSYNNQYSIIQVRERKPRGRSTYTVGWDLIDHNDNNRTHRFTTIDNVRAFLLTRAITDAIPPQYYTPETYFDHYPEGFGEPDGS